MIKKIGILGCGWLGFPLAKSFVKQGHQVNGSTTSIDKILPMAQLGINPFLIAIHNHHTEGNLDYFLQDLDVLIINLPPKLRLNPKANFVSKIQTLIKKIETATTKNIIFISSTSVYGNTHSVVTEDSQPEPETASGKQILEAEKLLMNCKNLSINIIRLAGLYGPGRHPVYQLSSKAELQHPNHPVNLIHLEDCIGIIHRVIKTGIKGRIINAVAPCHPTREKYYPQIAKQLDLNFPRFQSGESCSGKTVKSNFVNSILGYEFQYPGLDL